MRDGISKYGMPNYQFYTTGWDKIQKTYGCCGMDGYKDWKNTSFSQNSSNLVPSSCCVTSGCNITYERIHHNGCSKAFEADLRNKLYITGAIAALVTIFQIFNSIAACYIGSKAIKSHNWYSMLSFKRYNPC